MNTPTVSLLFTFMLSHLPINTHIVQHTNQFAHVLFSQSIFIFNSLSLINAFVYVRMFVYSHAGTQHSLNI